MSDGKKADDRSVSKNRLRVVFSKREVQLGIIALAAAIAGFFGGREYEKRKRKKEEA